MTLNIIRLRSVIEKVDDRMIIVVGLLLQIGSLLADWRLVVVRATIAIGRELTVELPVEKGFESPDGIRLERRPLHVFGGRDDRRLSIVPLKPVTAVGAGGRR